MLDFWIIAILCMGYFLLKSKQFGARAFRKMDGYTLIEMIIALAIVAFISAQMFVSFSSLNEASRLNRAANELAFNIRRAQNMALSISATKIGGAVAIPRGVGIKVSSDPSANTSYLFFADQNSDGIFTSLTEQMEPIVRLPDGIYISSVTGETLATRGVHLIYYTPEATLAMTNVAGVPIPVFVDIVLTGRSGAVRVVRIQTSGQVSVRQ